MIRQLRLDEFISRQQNKLNKDDVPIMLNKEERSFIKESLSWAEEGYNERSRKYHSRGDDAIPNYYQDHYLPTKAMFRKMRSMF